ncbi:MucBP domain-containing protein [Lactococcus garvieae]|uniref:MucBP domain-containing protein n=1 Tax=Lactococcus garvieae TaxID=1363 RepID=UPI00254F0498|nr:MucBP domain-containing protein [Lactococcus garvieae]
MKKKVIPNLLCSLLLVGSLNNSISVLASDVTQPQLESLENKDTKSNLTDFDSNTEEGESQSVAVADESIDSWMPDKNLQAAVSKKLNIPAESLTQNDMLKLTSFDAPSSGISSLKGLEYAVNLNADVDLNYNSISDISPLYSTQIYYLRLAGNNITDVSQFLNMPRVTTLVVPQNHIRDLSPLIGSQITTIIATDQKITLTPQEVFPQQIVSASSQVSRPGGGRVDSFSGVSSYDPNSDTLSWQLDSSNPDNVYADWNDSAWIRANYNAKGTGTAGFSGEIIQPLTYKPEVAADVTVNYVDEDGKAIPSVSPQTISGNVGDSYDATTDVYKLAIDGYTLDESKLPANAKGTLSDQAQTVTYVYEQIKDQSTVIVHDSELTVGDTWKPENNFDSATDYYGNVVPFSDINVEGQVDTTKAGIYKITYRRFVPNFFSTSENQGTYSAVATVTVKDAPPVKGGNVTAKYIDTDGNKVSDDVVKSGNVGDAYTTEQKAIEGYTFKEVQGNTAGQFTAQAQTVTYVYAKNEIPNITGTVLVKYVDTDGNKISEDIVKSGTVGEGYSTEKKDIKGYTFKEVQGITTGQFTDQVQTITYVYTKNKVNPVKPENKPDSKDKNNNKETTSSTQHSLPATGENERMTLMSIILGLFLLALGAIVSIFRFKKVNK